jgi:hypothetical protein
LPRISSSSALAAASSTAGMAGVTHQGVVNGVRGRSISAGRRGSDGSSYSQAQSQSQLPSLPIEKQQLQSLSNNSSPRGGSPLASGRGLGGGLGGGGGGGPEVFRGGKRVNRGGGSGDNDRTEMSISEKVGGSRGQRKEDTYSPWIELHIPSIHSMISMIPCVVHTVFTAHFSSRCTCILASC